MSERTPVGVLVSGAGTNLEALLRACAEPDYPAEVAVVISNRQAAPALQLARTWEVPAFAMPVSDYDGDLAARDRAMLGTLQAAQVELVVCAGYDRILSEELLAAYADAIINVHPSLLPAFAGGMDAVQRALDYGVKVTGCTVQLLEPGEVDGGPVILQAPVPVADDDDVDSLLARIHREEWRLLTEAVGLWSSHRLRRDGRHIHVVPANLAAHS
ncbi:MAG TPA: phosphoribosylglycinamide formyltransferase [Candidatus Dormibacteraeota bacterium]|nr:phosphoribosylglycinamide formyltransferase [Candidatus Dormibacteraeota bacterium]